MKILFFCLVLALSTQIPTDVGHTIATEQCDCAIPFKDTVKWFPGTRSGYYCNATAKSGKVYKRYFSSWLKLKKI